MQGPNTCRTAAGVVASLLIALPARGQSETTTMLPDQSAAPDQAVDESMPLGVTDQDGPAYVVSAFTLTYERPWPFLPDLADYSGDVLAFVDIELGRVAGGYVAPRPGVPTVTIEFEQLTAEGETTIYRSALEVILRALREATSDTVGLFFAPSPEAVAPDTGADLRPPGHTQLDLIVSFDGPFYPISRFELSYAITGHPDLPPVADIMAAVEVDLVPTPGGYVTWRPGVDPVALRPADMTGRIEMFSAGAVQLVLGGIRDYLTNPRHANLMGVHVVPAFDVETGTGTEIDSELADVRGGRTEFRLTIVTGIVTGVRTLAVGDRVPPEDRLDNESHEWIRKGSPLQPADPVIGRPADLLRKDVLDNYLFRLSRHPGRRVDAAIAPGDDLFGISLDYIVTENHPLLLYAQTSNTGTAQTERLRTRFGLYHNQLTGNDDIFSLEYITADFDDNNTFVVAYDAKFADSDRLRWRAYASWSEFSASEVGFANERFTGKSWTVGGELAWNIFQDRQFFVDVVAGARFLDTRVDTILPPPFSFITVTGDEQFLIPYAGLRFQRATEEVNSNLSVMFEGQLGDLTDVSAPGIDDLGRSDATKDWLVLKWDVSHSFYLEPVLNRAAWEDVSTPRSSTLAHEVALRFRGQYAFDNRLIPQMEQVAGGLFSVRGYPESVAVGDTVLLGTAEYRLHLPRALGVQENPPTLLGKPFRVVPQHPYGSADWDLVFRGFVDAARTINSDRSSFERDETLIGAGIGIQLLFLRNLDLRVDWGFALEGIPGEVNSGSNRLHFVATILY